MASSKDFERDSAYNNKEVYEDHDSEETIKGNKSTVSEIPEGLVVMPEPIDESAVLDSLCTTTFNRVRRSIGGLELREYIDDPDGGDLHYIWVVFHRTSDGKLKPISNVYTRWNKAKREFLAMFLLRENKGTMSGWDVARELATWMMGQTQEQAIEFIVRSEKAWKESNASN